MSLEQLAEKLAKMAAAEKAVVNGLKFNLLGLFVRKSDCNPIDLVAAAPGLNDGDLNSLRQVAKNLTGYFQPDDFSQIARIVILDQDSTILKTFLDAYAKRFGLVDNEFQTEGGVLIKNGYVVIAEPPNNSEPAGRISTSTRSQTTKGRSNQKKPASPRKNPEAA